MNCRTAMERSFARRDASLAADEEAALAAHLDRCPACREEETKRERMWRYLETLPVREPSANFDWRLKLRLSQLEREDGSVSARPRRVRPSRFSIEFAASAALAASLVVGLGVLWLRPVPHGEPVSRSSGVQEPGFVLPVLGSGRAHVTPASGRSHAGAGPERPRAAGRSFFVEESRLEIPASDDSLAHERARIGR